MISPIAVKVEDLVNSGVLNEGQGKALTKKLANAIEHLRQGDVNAAAGQLRAFANQVDAFVNAGILSPQEGQPLIDCANQIINVLTG